MSEFTPGKWWVAPFDVIGDAIYAPAQTESRRNEIVAFGITNKSDARLIAAAPEMYEMLKEELIPTSDYGGILSFSREDKLKKLFARIEGTEA